MRCFKDVYFWRQSLILIGDSVHSAGTGLMLSFSSVLNPALLSNSTDIRATPEEVSWIYKLGVGGMFAIFATCLLVCVIGLYFTLIETKDRTLQDIEDEIKGIKRTNEQCFMNAT
ncbi:uncharacterized protein LOC123710655 [Pieris brassicae]|uniref:uncharacterized protein LOC123710655 n=1 Tax=Pieris brassicae TaxID=7116 RepID=UPI001E65EE6A|nr:uncharacterized protein LOC123710655 [Pieris brassicae]